MKPIMKMPTLFLAAILAACFAATATWAQQGGGQRPTGGAYGTGLMGDAVIQYDEETGSIIVIADDETTTQIGDIIKSLDKPVLQVLIKVLFLEVTHSNGLDVGVDSLFFDTDARDTDGNLTSGHIWETAFGIASQTSGGFYRLLDDDVALTLRAMADVAKLEVLSRPSILVRNNHTATITIGKEVPFVRNTRISNTGQITNTVEYEDIGIILEVTPHITQDGLVEMEVAPEISTITGETVPISDTINAPVFAKRSASTFVVVPDGRTVVIGGLMEDNETQSIQKVPILGDIPLIGAVFRHKKINKTKTELLIFLTPIVANGMKRLTEVSLAEKESMELATEVFDKDRMSRFVGPMGETPPEPEAEEAKPRKRRGFFKRRTKQRDE